MFSHDKLVWEWCQEAVKAAASLASLSANDSPPFQHAAPRTKVEFSAPPSVPTSAPAPTAAAAAAGPTRTPSTSPTAPPEPSTSTAAAATHPGRDPQGDTLMEGNNPSSSEGPPLPGGSLPEDPVGNGAGPLREPGVLGGRPPSGGPQAEGSGSGAVVVKFSSLLEDPTIEGELMPEPFTSKNLGILRDELEASVVPEFRNRGVLRRIGVKELFRQAG